MAEFNNKLLALIVLVSVSTGLTTGIAIYHIIDQTSVQETPKYDVVFKDGSVIVQIPVEDQELTLYMRFLSNMTLWLMHDTADLCTFEQSTDSQWGRGYSLGVGGSGGVCAQNGSMIFFNFTSTGYVTSLSYVTFGFRINYNPNNTMAAVNWEWFWADTYRPLNHWGFYDQNWDGLQEGE